jgi:hypothetical protein
MEVMILAKLKISPEAILEPILAAGQYNITIT